AYKIGNSITEQFCSDIEVLSCAEPIFETIPGWQSDTTKARKWNELPTNARAYLEFISNYVGVPVSIASIGPERTETIIARPELLWG
ncbi:MAG: adenylosuccinate synthetase, partial [bacterium]